MSIDTQAFLISYGFVALLVLVGSALVLDGDTRARGMNRRYTALSERERIWIGRAGLACLLWPAMGAAILGYVIYHLFHTLVQAARGRR